MGKSFLKSPALAWTVAGLAAVTSGVQCMRNGCDNEQPPAAVATESPEQRAERALENIRAEIMRLNRRVISGHMHLISDTTLDTTALVRAIHRVEGYTPQNEALNNHGIAVETVIIELRQSLGMEALDNATPEQLEVLGELENAAADTNERAMRAALGPPRDVMEAKNLSRPI